MSLVSSPLSASAVGERSPAETNSRPEKGSGALNSWKEIAAYLRCGVRTVQRWERELGLPVHRPYGRARSSVLALRPELDAWMAARNPRRKHNRA